MALSMDLLIDFITFPSTGDAVDFGNAKRINRYAAGFGNGITGGVKLRVEEIQYNLLCSMETGGNFVDFGDMTEKFKI